MWLRDADSEVGSPGAGRERQDFEADAIASESNRPPNPTQRVAGASQGAASGIAVAISAAWGFSMATQVLVSGNLFPGRSAPIPFGPARRHSEHRRPKVLPPLRPHPRPRRAAAAEDLATRHNALVLSMLPLVKRVAYQMRERLPLHIELHDLVSSGVIGLVDAVRKFDGRKQVRLDQYARHRIRGAILDGLRSLDTVSRDMRKKNRKAETAYHRFEMKFGRPPSDEELAAELGMSLSAWYRTECELQSIGLSWLRPLGVVGRTELRSSCEDSLAADNRDHQFESCYRREQKEILDRALARIPLRERRIVQLYYYQALTMKGIGKILGIDESRVSQLHSAALARLRRQVKDLLRGAGNGAPRYAQ
jgi:RNA polymerase sigma factor for flagellar operon FliA